jgi:hypothetical protein
MPYTGAQPFHLAGKYLLKGADRLAGKRPSLTALALVVLLGLNLVVLLQNRQRDEKRLAWMRDINARIAKTQTELKRTHAVAALAIEACDNPVQDRLR